jgi:leucyl aminopeptidase (aminopeptidase T)
LSGAPRLDAAGALRRLATVCAAVEAGERCLLVTDHAADQEIVGGLGWILAGLGAEVVVVGGEPVALPGDEPPAAVATAMAGADVVFELTSNFAGSSRARVEACERGARYLTVPGLTWATLRRGGPFEADFAALGEHARMLAAKIDAASEFHLTSPAGTDLRGSFTGRHGRPLWGLADRPGGYAAPPDVEVGAAPVEGTAEGTVVVDGSVLFLGPDQLPGPIELTFVAGQLVELEGAEAWRLRDAIELSGDERMSNLAEVSIGLNPLSRPGGSALELEGIVGGAHVALGNNVPYGGDVDARAHIDCVLLEATLSLDGVPLDPGQAR